MFVDTLKAAITQAVKDKDATARDVLRLALGEIQMAEVRGGRAPTDDEATAIVKKLVKSNEETLALTSDDRADTLRREIAVLSSLLPKSLIVDQIVEALASQAEALRTAKNDGPATGMAMKHLKTSGAVFDGKDVGEAVKKLRA